VVVERPLVQVTTHDRAPLAYMPLDEGMVEPLDDRRRHDVDRPEQLGRRHVGIANRGGEIERRARAVVLPMQSATHFAAVAFALERDAVGGHAPSCAVAPRDEIPAEAREHERFAEYLRIM